MNLSLYHYFFITIKKLLHIKIYQSQENLHILLLFHPPTECTLSMAAFSFLASPFSPLYFVSNRSFFICCVYSFLKLSSMDFQPLYHETFFESLSATFPLREAAVYFVSELSLSLILVEWKAQRIFCYTSVQFQIAFMINLFLRFEKELFSVWLATKGYFP